MKLFWLGEQRGKAKEGIPKAKERAKETAHQYVSTVQVHIFSGTARSPFFQWTSDLVSGVANLDIHLGNDQRRTRAPTRSSSKVKALYLLSGVIITTLTDVMTVTAVGDMW
mgnify:CR=1 FL=1